MVSNDGDVMKIKLVSFNMHGFHQGCSVVEDLINDECPDVIMLQEHWLTPAKLYNFEKHFSGFFSFGSSAMTKCLESGLLRGRPYGGVMTLISDKLRKHTVTVHCDERFVIVKVLSCLFINVYLPCSGTMNRLTACVDLLADIWSWREYYSDCKCVIGGDFNTNLDSSDEVARCLTDFINDCLLVRCDDLFPSQKVNTFVNLSLNQESRIDYVLVSDASDVSQFTVLDPDINFSDHLPLFTVLTFPCSSFKATTVNSSNRPDNLTLPQLRWDKANRDLYYQHTGQCLVPMVDTVDDMLIAYKAGHATVDCVHDCIESCYKSVVSTLNSAADTYVPKRRKGYYKFWWDEELNLLKEASVETNNIWKAAGKPRNGPIFINRQSSRLLYRKRLREHKQMDTQAYSNDLHKALLLKNTVFWKTWRSKFNKSVTCGQVDGSVDPQVIADNFVSHFRIGIHLLQSHEGRIFSLAW